MLDCSLCLPSTFSFTLLLMLKWCSVNLYIKSPPVINYYAGAINPNYSRSLMTDCWSAWCKTNSFWNGLNSHLLMRARFYTGVLDLVKCSGRCEGWTRVIAFHSLKSCVHPCIHHATIHLVALLYGAVWAPDSLSTKYYTHGPESCS